jgi:hypothetical protein
LAKLGDVIGVVAQPNSNLTAANGNSALRLSAPLSIDFEETFFDGRSDGQTGRSIWNSTLR